MTGSGSKFTPVAYQYDKLWFSCLIKRVTNNLEAGRRQRGKVQKDPAGGGISMIFPHSRAHLRAISTKGPSY
jgi:hypothetical protein